MPATLTEVYLIMTVFFQIPANSQFIATFTKRSRSLTTTIWQAPLSSLYSSVDMNHLKIRAHTPHRLMYEAQPNNMSQKTFIGF
jgi:hypothetical protein